MVAAALRILARLNSVCERGGLVIAFRVRGAWWQPGPAERRAETPAGRAEPSRGGAVPFPPSFLPSFRALTCCFTPGLLQKALLHRVLLERHH